MKIVEYQINFVEYRVKIVEYRVKLRYLMIMDLHEILTLAT